MRAEGLPLKVIAFRLDRSWASVQTRLNMLRQGRITVEGNYV